jgi:hypothetical protein
VIIASRRRAVLLTVAALAALGGSLVAVCYHRRGLTLSHYDARAHLVVARRIIDSLTPGWQQIGAVWLPLPHLINAPAVQLDGLYRSGASAVAWSVAAFALATAAIARIVFTLTTSPLAALSGAAVFALNPNVLYLQATPMTELLLVGLTAAGVALLLDAVTSPSVMGSVDPGRAGDATSKARSRDRLAGWLFLFACLTRYEAWPVTTSALGAACYAWWRGGHSGREAAVRTLRIARYPATAVLAFLGFSRIVGGEWFVSGRFFVPDNVAHGRPYVALSQIGWGLRELSGSLLLAVGAAGLVMLLVLGLLRRRLGGWLVPLSLTTTAAVPLAAFVEGHPYRIRYMVALLAAEAIGAGVAVGLFSRFRLLRAAGLAVALLLELRPLSPAAPMVVEAQWDRPNAAMRRSVTECLRSQYAGEIVMVSMGSLGHYLQELAQAGFALRDFLHEGNGDIWLSALDRARPYVGWVLIEEQAEGGDVLAERSRADPAFLQGFFRACEGGGVVLYRRVDTGLQGSRDPKTPALPERQVIRSGS